jgi:hypothetical protein
VQVSAEEKEVVQNMAARLKSDTSTDPVTGAMLGMNGNGTQP